MYIVTQGPTEEFVCDFWRMVWQKKCRKIVALTRLVEHNKILIIRVTLPRTQAGSFQHWIQSKMLLLFLMFLSDTSAYICLWTIGLSSDTFQKPRICSWSLNEERQTHNTSIRYPLQDRFS